MNSDMEWYIVVWSIQVGRVNDFSLSGMFFCVFLLLWMVWGRERERSIEDLVPRVTCEMKDGNEGKEKIYEIVSHFVQQGSRRVK